MRGVSHFVGGICWFKTKMREKIVLIGCHAEGEVGDVAVAGVERPPGSTIWQQSRWIALDRLLRLDVFHDFFAQRREWQRAVPENDVMKITNVEPVAERALRFLAQPQ